MSSEEENSAWAELRKRDWPGDTTGFEPYDYASAFGTPADALMYACLFFPEFKEFEGMVFRDDEVSDPSQRDRILKTLIRFGGDRERVEQSFNLFEYPSSFFAASGYSSSSQQLGSQFESHLLNFIAEGWLFRLRAQFPGYAFEVQIISEAETGGEPGLCFYRVRSK